MAGQELKLLEDFERDSKWFHENIDTIRKKGLVGKFVAIKNENVISSGVNADLMIQSLEERGENPSYIFIEFVHPEGFTLIL